MSRIHQFVTLISLSLSIVACKNDESKTNADSSQKESKISSDNNVSRSNIVPGGNLKSASGPLEVKATNFGGSVSKCEYTQKDLNFCDEYIGSEDRDQQALGEECHAAGGAGLVAGMCPAERKINGCKREALAPGEAAGGRTYTVVAWVYKPQIGGSAGLEMNCTADAETVLPK